MHDALRGFLLALALLSCVGACAGPGAGGEDPQSRFLAHLGRSAGEAFEGRIVADEPPPAAESPFAGKRLVMHVRRVEPGRLEIPFHVGDDRSRTWILTRFPGKLHLAHDHRHEDGSDDELTRYGGLSESIGTERRQEFPADPFSKELFERLGFQASTANVWALEIDPGRSFTYELARPGRLFRVEFDLTHPVPPPPAPWGW